MRILELCLVLTVAFGPSLFLSLTDFFSSFPSTGSANGGTDYSLRAPRSINALLGTDLRYLSSLAVCAYVLFRQGRSFRLLGLGWRKTDLPLGVALGLGHYLVYHAMQIVFRDGGIHAGLPHGLLHYMDGAGAGRTVAERVASSLYFVGHTALIGLFEEMIVRAYLMTEVTFLTGSVPFAVLLSVTLQAAYHLYQGWPSALSLAAAFLVFSLFYASTWRATPIVLAHMLLDLNNYLRQTWV